MATIGELIESLKGYGDDPDPIRPEDSDGNGLLEPYGDDIPTSVKEKIGEYLHQRTGGPSSDNALENINMWPVEDTEGASDYSLTDANGKPVGPTANEYGFTTTYEDALNEAIRVFESEGAFFGGGVDEENHVDTILNKDGQEDGHDVLNRFAGAPFDETTGRTHESMPAETKAVLDEVHPEVATSATLRNNRWTRGYYPENDTTFGLQNADTPMFGALAGKIKDTQRRYTPDRPFVDSAYINKDYSEEMTKNSGDWPETDGLLGTWMGHDPLGEEWNSIPFDDAEGKLGYLEGLLDKMRELNYDTPDWYYVGKQSFVAAFLMQLVLEVVGLGISGLGAAITKPEKEEDEDGIIQPSRGVGNVPNWDLAYGSSIGRKSDILATPPETGLGAALLDALPIGGSLDFESMMNWLEIPVPWTAIDALAYEDDFWGSFIGATVGHLGKMIGDDASMVVFWSPFLRHFVRLLTDLDKLWPMPKLSDAGEVIPGAQLLFALDAFLMALRDSSVIRLIRALVSLGEALFASGGDLTTTPAFSPNGFKHGTDNRGYWDTHPSFAPFRSRTRVLDEAGKPAKEIAQSINRLPSMYLLPGGFSNSARRFGQGTGDYTQRNAALLANHLINPSLHHFMGQVYGTLLEDAKTVESALHSKIGPPTDTTRKRFAPAEVNFIEGLLEAEYMPFYIQDLRTNEIVAFHAFLSSLSDSFSPSYNATSGFGRIEDVQVYQKTSRSISVTFTMAAMQKEDMNEMYVKLNKLVTMVYPQWSRGTVLQSEFEAGNANYVQPFSQIPTATPVVRLRIGDIIQTNYSKFNLTRLFGTSEGGDKGWGTGENPEGHHYDNAVKAAQAICKQTPVDAETGDPDESKGFPVDSEVYVVLPSATSHYGRGRVLMTRFKATINSYKKDPGFSRAERQKKGSGDVLVKVTCDNDIFKSVTYKDPNDVYAGTTTSTSSEVTVYYKHLITDGTSFARSVSNSVTWPMLAENSTVKPHLDADAEAERKLEAGDLDTDAGKIAAEMFGPNNPLFKAFESSMGRGLAGVITGLDIGYKLNEAPWDIDPGTRGPTMLEISIGFTPIHDIPPGLDSDGYNRAPVYKMASSGDIAGDAWDGQNRIESSPLSAEDQQSVVAEDKRIQAIAEDPEVAGEESALDALGGLF